MSLVGPPFEEKPKRPEPPVPPPLEFDRETNTVGALLAIGVALILLVLLASGCLQ